MSQGGGSKSSSSGESSSRVQIPGFLEPFIRDSTATAGRALGSLESLLGLTGTPAESISPTMLQNVRGPNGQAVFVDPASNSFVDASGRLIAPFQDGVVPGLVNGSDNPVEVRGGDVVGVGTRGDNELFTMPLVSDVPGGSVTTDNLVAGFTPAQIAAQSLGLDRVLSGDLFSSAQDATQGIASNGVDLSALQQLESMGLDPSVISSLRSQIDRGPLAGTEALEATARGDYLMGGPGFDAAVDAAVRAATPGIVSTFGSAGAGGATGGLAQEALGTAAIDAFARQYAQERGNQLGAAGQLADLDLAGGTQGINAANILGTLGLSADDQALRAALGETNANLGNASTMLDAARLIPGLATADLDLLEQIGATQQGQAQSELDAPRVALLQLMQAALGGTPIESLLGSDNTQRGDSRSLFLGFGGQ